MNVPKLTPLPGMHLPDDFDQAVRMLKRPYFRLNKNQVEQIHEMAMTKDSDILTDMYGTLYTWGNADGCIQLMPLQEKFYYKFI